MIPKIMVRRRRASAGKKQGKQWNQKVKLYLHFQGPGHPVHRTGKGAKDQVVQVKEASKQVWPHITQAAVNCDVPGGGTDEQAYEVRRLQAGHAAPVILFQINFLGA
jgi:hypothetical protein